ncbi:MAG: zf-HC2 domain-containing protein [Thiobacillus sp.]|nr:zf-HC2 domain-containing protein [Thiobacillus sp.]
MKWIPTCRDATELASRAMDERLPLTNRMALRLHLAICENCTRFNQQLQEMRRLFREETGANDDAAGLAPEARRRIESELQKKLGS